MPAAGFAATLARGCWRYLRFARSSRACVVADDDWSAPWQRLLDEGRYPTANDLARSLKLEPGWVAEVLRLTTLAPDIIELVLEGRQPRDLNLHTLRGRRDQLPRDWQEQRKALGFAP